jgi:carboxymethylenebutenolidase
MSGEEDFQTSLTRGCLVRPDKARTKGGVLLLPSIHGREKYIMNYIDGLVAAGYPTVLWDLFAGQEETHDRESRHSRGASLSDSTSIDQMSSLVTHMLEELRMPRVVALGFCLGGRYGLALGARDERLAGIVSYYPSINDPRRPSEQIDVTVEASKIKCPVHLIAPGNDHITSRKTFETLQASLEGRDQPTNVQFFPHAEHAFLQVERRQGAANAEAIAMSRAGAFAFLECVLGER